MICKTCGISSIKDTCPRCKTPRRIKYDVEYQQVYYTKPIRKTYWRAIYEDLDFEEANELACKFIFETYHEVVSPSMNHSGEGYNIRIVRHV